MLLRSVFERLKKLVGMDKRGVRVEAWVGWLAMLLKWDQEEQYKSSMPSTGGRFFLTGDGYKPQDGHSDISISLSKYPVYFFVVNGSELGKIYA